MGENCCRNAKKAGKAAVDDCNPNTPNCSGMKLHQTCSCAKIASLAGVTESTPLAFKEDTALIFPPFLRKYAPGRIQLNRPDCTWIKPGGLSDLVALKSVHPDAKLVCGNTEAGIDMKFRFDARPWKTMIYCSDIKELTAVNQTKHGVTLGASVTINTLQVLLKKEMASYDPASQLIANAILTQIHWFAGTQIRNVATLAGNICTASPISDLNPVWQAVDGVVLRVAKGGCAERVVPGAEFFTGYRQTAMDAKEVLVSLFIPLKHKEQADASASSVAAPLVFTHAYKQSRRRADDIAIVTSCMQLSVVPQSGKLVFAGASLSYGGMAPATALARKTAAYLAGKEFCLAEIQRAMLELKSDFPLLDAKVLPGGMAEYRMVLAASFLLKMFYFTWKNLKVDAVGGAAIAGLLEEFPANAESVTEEYERDVSAGTQTYRVRDVLEDAPAAAPAGGEAEEKASNGHANAPAIAPRRSADRSLIGDASLSRPAQSGEALRHLSALKQCSGEAKYLDDMALTRGEMYVGLVMSTEPHARILAIDTSALESHSSFTGFWSSKDVPGDNHIGDIIHDEELFASEEVVCVGTLIGAVLGRTQIEANQLAKMVKVTYEKLPTIFTIDEAIAAKSFIAPWTEGHELVQGDVPAGFAKATHVLEGEARIGGQEHFYRQSHTARIARPSLCPAVICVCC